MDQKWNKYEYVCSYCDSAITFVTTITQDQMLCPVCFNGYATLLSVADATINTNNETKEVPPMSATTDYLERSVAALQDLLEKKEAYITRLQDEVSQKSSYAFTVKAEKQNLINTLKEYVIEALRDREMMQGNAEAIAEICDFELTKTLTITSTVDFEIEVEVPFDTDADDVIASLEYSVDAFDYSITDYSLDTQSTNWEDSIS